MDETKLNILICGVTSDSSTLFISLFKYLKSSGHQVSFFVPEYSGAVCLIEQKIRFIRLKDIECESYLSIDENILLEECLEYDLKQTEFDSKHLRGIKRNHIVKDGHKLFSACKKYFGECRIDLIVVWGGIRSYSSIPVAIAKKNNLNCVFIEKGLFPFTLQVDDKGVNASGKLKNEFSKGSNNRESNSIDFYQSLLKEKWSFIQPVNAIKIKTKVKYLLREFAVNEFLLKIYHKYFETKLQKKFTYKDNWKVTDPSSNLESIKDSEYIFIPFQVSDDSQLLIHGNWIRDNISLVKSIHKSLNDLGIKRKIIIKEHPREFRNLDFQERLRKYDVQFSKAGTIDLITKSKVIVTINSTVGFEALVFNKPVVITGNAFYESIPLILKSNDQEELTLNLKKILKYDLKFEEIEVNKYISTVYYKHVKCNYASPSEIEVLNLWQKIHEIQKVDS
jgi:capsular polysaccharide export protein